MEENKFVNGLFYNEPPKNAPDFILASMSIRPDVFMEWLREQKANDSGYVRIAVKRSKGGKVYCEVDNWEKTAHRGSQSVTEGAEEYPEEEINPNDVPFR